MIQEIKKHFFRLTYALKYSRVLQIARKIFPSKRTKMEEYTAEYARYFDNLFAKAANAGGFQYLCTILRVEGLTSGHWDAFVEAEEASRDISNILRKTKGNRKEKRAIRLGLFLYCHLTEMSAPYEILANLLRGCQNAPYSVYPFHHLVRIVGGKNTQPWEKKRLPPSPAAKIAHLEELGKECGEEELNQIINEFFRNNVRNAFYHSDYALSDDEFRIVEGSQMLGKEVIKIEELSEYLTKCFAFYSAFFIVYNNIRRGLAYGKKFHRWPNYEVLEFLTDEKELNGFKVHFPNGSHAMFQRKKYGGTDGYNFMFEKEGIGLQVGDLKKYHEATDWFVGDEPFDEFGTRYNPYGKWQPIVFSRDSDRIQKMARDATEDRDAEGCLFYIYATGHKAIEFVLKTNKPITWFSSMRGPFWSVKKNFIVKKCDPVGGAYIYDGTVFLDGKSEKDVLAGLARISEFVTALESKGIEVKSRLKYQMYSDLSDRAKDGGDGTFSVTISMDDPRSTLVANNLGMFPKSDWKIRPEWI
ncbi:hypothetical protein JXR01_03585 [Candidatus Kaiserbacteria bacterium]|nr:MAG: hypothetical protein JXR01_03585 [Candidatus Kaiserbacteria bacterium]